MWYNKGYEKTHFYPTAYPRRTATHPERIAFVRCFCLAPLPDLAGPFSRRTGPCHIPPAWLRRPEGPQCHQRLQCDRGGRAARRLLTPPPPTNHVYRRRMPAITRALASQSTRLWQRSWRVDLGTGGPGQFRARYHRHRGFHRKCASSPQTTQNELETGQALDYQPRPPVSAKKNAHDRLIAWASHQPAWASGFLDEVWWSRFALPHMRAWQDPEHPLRLIE